MTQSDGHQTDHSAQGDQSHATEVADVVLVVLETAQRAAREAGSYLIAKQGHVRIAGQKSLHDFLLDADLEAERIILDTVRAAFPAHGILSEEAGASNTTADYRWIVDPLDGSANFQHGSPLFGVAIAFQVKRRTTLGIIHLPAFDQLFYAQRGHGATLNGNAITVSAVATLDGALIHFGDFAKNGRHEENIERMVTMTLLADVAGRVRMVGSAALDFAAIASGRADGLITYAAHPWDLEAGHLLLREAGGRFSTTTGHSGNRCFVASNRLIHDHLRRIAHASQS